MERRVKHWSEVISQRIIEEKEEPFVIASGITTSGPTHMGTACEFLYPSALARYLEDNGYKTEFVFIGDLMDAFDRIPRSLQRFTFLKEHLGKPLCKVPDPYGCCGSYGEHFLNETMDLMEKLEVDPKILRTDELYASGRYDPYARLFHARGDQVKGIARRVAKISGAPALPSWIDVVMPICENCGRIATTVVKSFDGSTIRYSCSRDVGYAKGCGYSGEMSISDHRYKLFWRLDWPSRQDFLGVSAELAGADHHTRGGSWETAVAVHREIFNKDPPIGHKYGFVLLHGKKYSKSKGMGLSVQELLKLVPPMLIKYDLFKTDVEENKEFDPSGHKLIRLYDEYQRAADLYESGGRLRRAEEKMVLAYKLSTDRRMWRASFTDMLMYYQIYRDWDKVAEVVGDEEGVGYLKRYIERWVSQEYLPEEFAFTFKPERIRAYESELAILARSLDERMSAEEVHNLVYTIAKERGVDAPSLFKAIYLTLIGKDHGPRLGRLIVAIGVDKVKKIMTEMYEKRGGDSCERSINAGRPFVGPSPKNS